MERTQGQDLYEVLQVSPHAHPLIITKAFRLLAALYHPDNKETGNQEAFKQLSHAYRILSDPVRRADYDREHLGALGSHPDGFIARDESAELSDRRDWDEQELRHFILHALYDVRRGRPYHPGVSLLVLSELAGCSVESLQYTLWYLRGKHYIDTADDSEIVITVDGVDFLEASGVDRSGVRSDERHTPPVPLPFPNDFPRGLRREQSGGAQSRTEGANTTGGVLGTPPGFPDVVASGGCNPVSARSGRNPALTSKDPENGRCLL